MNKFERYLVTAAKTTTPSGKAFESTRALVTHRVATRALSRVIDPDFALYHPKFEAAYDRLMESFNTVEYLLTGLKGMKDSDRLARTLEEESLLEARKHLLGCIDAAILLSSRVKLHFQDSLDAFFLNEDGDLSGMTVLEIELSRESLAWLTEDALERHAERLEAFAVRSEQDEFGLDEDEDAWVLWNAPNQPSQEQLRRWRREDRAFDA